MKIGMSIYGPHREWVTSTPKRNTDKLWKACNHTEHNPPSHLVIKDRYEHKCPECGRITVIEPNQSTL